MSERPKGHIRDEARPAGVVHHDRLVGAVEVPPTMSLADGIDIDDQAGSSCTGSDAKLVEVWCAARGIPCAPASRRFTYTLGRELSDPVGPLVDRGAMPAMVVSGMRDFGIVPEAAYPSYDLAQINDPLNFDALEQAFPFIVSGISVIEEDGAARCAAMRRAIAARFPVGLAIEVDQTFEAWTGDAVFDGLRGPRLGGHRIRVVGYRPGAFLIANSWSRAWGFGGLAWLSDAFVGSAQAYDPYILSFAQALAGAA